MKNVDVDLYHEDKQDLMKYKWLYTQMYYSNKCCEEGRGRMDTYP